MTDKNDDEIEDFIKRNGGPAFPLTVEESERTTHFHQGMTLRDYFAAKAEVKDLVLRALQMDTNFSPDIEEIINLTASLKYQEADAMLKERDK